MGFDGFLIGMMLGAVVLRLGLYLALEAREGGPSFLSVFFDRSVPVHPVARRVMWAYAAAMCCVGLWLYL